MSSLASSGSNGGTMKIYTQISSGTTQQLSGSFQPGLGLLILRRISAC